MNGCRRRPSSPRRAEPGLRQRGLAACAPVWLCVLLVAPAAPARAQDTPREFADWPSRLPRAASAAASAPGRKPVSAVAWERLSRTPQDFAPPLPAPGNAALQAAAEAGRWAEVLRLLKAGAAQARAADSSGANVLERAAAVGEAEVVRELLSRGADPDRVSDRGYTPAGAAAFNGQTSVLRQLARGGADLRRWGATGQAPLHLASLAGRSAVVTLLLKLGADPEALNRQRETPLDVAAAQGRGEVLDLLLAVGADATRAGRR